jgi:5-(carboxyamino)imidazole ribonucleotide synthase
MADIIELSAGQYRMIMPSIMVNLLGEPGYKGDADYEGLKEVLATENVFVHLYGKAKTSPGRKMGHVTIINPDKLGLVRLANQVKKLLKIVSLRAKRKNDYLQINQITKLSNYL